MNGDKERKDMTDEEWTESMFVAAMEASNAPSREYVYFDEREDVLSSLELLVVIAPFVYERPQLWKWMIVAAQSALQGAMVCALVDSTGTSVLKEEFAAKKLAWLQSHAEAQEPPQEWLKDFNRLLAKCEAEIGLVFGEKQREDIIKLHGYFRNSFIHFTPKGWGIEKRGLPQIIASAIDAVESLMALNRIGVRLEEFQSARLKSLLIDIRGSIAAYAKSLASGS